MSRKCVNFIHKWRWPKNYRFGICFILIKYWKNEKSVYFDHVTTKIFVHNFFSILQYIIHPQKVSEQSTHYFYKSKLMVDVLEIVLSTWLVLISLGCLIVKLASQLWTFTYKIITFNIHIFINLSEIRTKYFVSNENSLKNGFMQRDMA